jgi:uncharacterized protein involved in response to NO
MALFADGFRPFFLLAGLSAVLNLAVWLAVLAFDGWQGAPLEPMRWHMHEMLFGFVAAAIAGFLLTAVPNWTGRPAFEGPPLVALVVLWIAGRLVLVSGVPVPTPIAAAVDLAFFPALIATVLPALTHAGNRRNYPIALLLALLTTANLLCWLEVLGLTGGTFDVGVLLALDIVLLLVSVIGGRIVPAFTANALKRRNVTVTITPLPWLDRAAIGSVVALLVLDLVAYGSLLTGLVALAAGIVHAVRLGRWQGSKTLGEPILWILHAAYAWIPIALVLKGGWIGLDLWGGRLWVHALTIGAFSGMILAVTTRAALGHTGRPLVAARPIALAYALIMLAAVVRVFGPVVLPTAYMTTVWLAGAAWIGAFALFLVVYTPMLLRPRTG